MSEQTIELMDKGALVLQAPDRVLKEAQRAAQALMGVINAKPKKVMMNNKVYLELEDWTTMGRFFNTTPAVISDQYVEFGDVHGFEATAEAITYNRDGMKVTVTRATSMCLNDETNWGDRPQYVWEDELGPDGKKQWVDDGKGSKKPKKKRVLVGNTATPLFQLRSMAQTRACAKALRLAFSWVVVLANNEGANISTTPVEEMDGDNVFDENGEVDKTPPINSPQKKEPPKGKAISEGQKKRMYAIAKEAGFDPDSRVKLVTEAYGYQHVTDVVMGKGEGQYDAICAAITDKTWKAPAAPAPKLVPVTVEGKCLGVKEIPGDGDRYPYVIAEFEGREVHCMDQKTLDTIRTAVDKECKFACSMREGQPDKVKLVGILKIGDKEWDAASGLPVIDQRKL